MTNGGNVLPAEAEEADERPIAGLNPGAGAVHQVEIERQVTPPVPLEPGSLSRIEDSTRALLKETSRSFYLTLRVLPSTVRSQIGLAYLLARTTDTIADTELVSLESRLQALHDLRRRISGESSLALDFGDLAAHQAAPAERRLLEQCETSLSALRMLDVSDQQLVSQVLEIITSGQVLDLNRFAGASEKNVLALKTADELDDYTYRVAGCVGEFWTRMCRAHVFPQATLDAAVLLANAVRFGKGLQLVNILRDLPADLRIGRCYLPQDRLSDVGLTPAQLLDPANAPRLRPLYSEYLDRAFEHLKAGWAYTVALPQSCARVRLACAWPILIGIETLHLLRCSPVLDPSRRFKVSRACVRWLMLKSIVLHPFPGLWRTLARI